MLNVRCDMRGVEVGGRDFIRLGGEGEGRGGVEEIERMKGWCGKDRMGEGLIKGEGGGVER
jgi:hypothetical protein